MEVSVVLVRDAAVTGYLVLDVSRRHSGVIFRCQNVQDEGTCTFSGNGGNQNPLTQCHIPETSSIRAPKPKNS